MGGRAGVPCRLDAREAGDDARDRRAPCGGIGGDCACVEHAVADRRGEGRHHAAGLRRLSGSERLPGGRPEPPDDLPAQRLQRQAALALRGALPGHRWLRRVQLRRPEQSELDRRPVLRLQPQRTLGRHLPVRRHEPPGEVGPRSDRRPRDRVLQREQDRRARLGGLAGDVQHLHRPGSRRGRDPRQAVGAQGDLRTHRRDGRELQSQRELTGSDRAIRRAVGPDWNRRPSLRDRRLLHGIPRAPDREGRGPGV